MVFMGLITGQEFFITANALLNKGKLTYLL
jgi:hypothetical protein